MRAKRSPFEPVRDVSAADFLEVAAALVESRGLVARVPVGTVTLDSLVALAARGKLSSARLEDAAKPLPLITGRVGAARALSLYVAHGCKYALAPRGAITPRSAYALAALHPAEVAAEAGPPAVVAPNATLKGALARMAERRSICAFVVRAGRLKGVVDAWTALGEAVERGESGLEASCSCFASTEPVLSALDEAAGALAERGFAAAAAGGRLILIDDASLHRALLAYSSRWLPRVG